MAGQPRDDQPIEMRVSAPERGPAAHEPAVVDLDGPGQVGPGRAPTWVRWVGTAVVIAVVVGVGIMTRTTAGSQQVLATGAGDRLVPAPGVPATTPTLRWEVELAGSTLDGLVQVDGMVVAMTTTSEPASAEDQPSPHRSEVVAIDSLTGQRVWTRVLDWTPRAPRPDPDEVFFGWGFDPPLVHVRGAGQTVSVTTVGVGSPQLRQVLLDGASGDRLWTIEDPADAPPAPDVRSAVARPGETAVTWSGRSAWDSAVSSRVVDLTQGTVLEADGELWPLAGSPLSLRDTTGESTMVVDDVGTAVLEVNSNNVVVLDDVLVAVTDAGLVGVDEAGAARWEARLPVTSGGWWMLRQVDEQTGLVVQLPDEFEPGDVPGWAATVTVGGEVREVSPGTAFVAGTVHRLPVVAGPESPRLLCEGLLLHTTCPAPMALVDADGTVHATSDQPMAGSAPGSWFPTSWRFESGSRGGGVATQLGVLGVELTGDLQGRLVLRSWQGLQPLWDADLDDAPGDLELVLVPSASGIAVGTDRDDFSPVTVAWFS